MKNAIWGMLNDAEKALLRAVQPGELGELDEDELLELHGRVRRARSKYTKLYRRRATAQVGQDAGRAGAHAKHARTMLKAEAFEDGLARVSRRLAKLARQSAEQLKDERLAAARGAKAGSGGAKRRSSSGEPLGLNHADKAKKKGRSPQSKRASAQSRAATRRKEAKRASR